MQVTLGEEGLAQTWQAKFPAMTDCCHCEGRARIGFVAHEGGGKENGPYVCSLHENKGEGGYWPHDCCNVAVYFCRDCLGVTALYNQA